MSTYSAQIKTNPHFCMLPFTHMHVTTSGAVNACCVANYEFPIISDVKDKTLQDIWVSSEYQDIRRAMLNGDRIKNCEYCYKLDESGGGSDRQTHNSHFINTYNSSNADWDIDVEHGNTDSTPIWVDIRPGRFCNLGCRMCFVSISSTVADEHKKYPELKDVTGEQWFDIEDWIDNDTMYASLQKLIPSLKTIKLAGGEPLFMPGVIKLIKWCVESGNTHLHIDITTNGTRTTGKIANWLKMFSKADIQFSIDGIGIVNDYIRNPSKWKDIDIAYKKYKSLNLGSVNILSTVQIYNAFDLINIIDYWKENGADNKLIFNFVNYPKDMTIDILPLEDRLTIISEIEKRTESLSEHAKQQWRIDALSYRLRQEFDPVSTAILRKKFALRTIKYDTIRHQSIEQIHPKLAEYVTQWALL